MLARARSLEAEGREILHLEIGDPDFPTPPHVVRAAEDAIAQGYTHYPPSPGLPELRAAIARHLAETRATSGSIRSASSWPPGRSRSCSTRS